MDGHGLALNATLVRIHESPIERVDKRYDFMPGSVNLYFRVKVCGVHTGDGIVVVSFEALEASEVIVVLSDVLQGTGKMFQRGSVCR